LRWPVDEVCFDPRRQIGTSNEALGPIELSVDAPMMLVILPLSELDGAMAALLDCGAGWSPQRTL
jgi:thiamine pyrophosphokinase